jgi:hypothetical protein
MFSRDVTYTDLNGRQRTRKLTFNILAQEAMKLEFNFDEGFVEAMRRAAEEEDRLKIFSMLELLVSVSYGKPNADGSELVKDPEWLKELLASKYYEELFLWLFSKQENIIAFVSHIIPKDLDARLGILAGDNKTESDKIPVSGMSIEELEAQIARLKGQPSLGG